MIEFHDNLAGKIIVRPDVSHHFMRLRPLNITVTSSYNNTEIAASSAAIKLFEVGKDFYDPVIYFPRSDIKMELLTVVENLSTHCPLKGDTEYFDISTHDKTLEKAAWSYNKPLQIAEELRDLIAFDASVINIIEHK